MDKEMFKPDAKAIVQNIYATVLWGIVVAAVAYLGNMLDPWGLRKNMTPISALIFYSLLALGLFTMFSVIWKAIKGLFPKKLIPVASKHFRNEIIVLDGKYFLDCVFEDCKVRWNGGEFGFHNVRRVSPLGFESQNTRIVATIDVLKMMNFLDVNFANSWVHIPKEFIQSEGAPYYEQRQEVAPKATTKGSKKGSLH